MRSGWSAFRTALAHRMWHLRARLDRCRADAAVIGWPATIRLILADRTNPSRPTRPIRLPGYDHPVHIRAGSSDALVARQVFARREYACTDDQPDVRYILDCGANIGCTARYFLRRFPAARVVTVEPDSGNMTLCRKNLAPFGDRVLFVQAGVWSRAVPMTLDRGEFRDGREWSFQARPADPGEPVEFDAVTIPDLIRRSGFPRIDILKMDIEAAEEEVFRTGTAEWLPLVRTLVIELHGPACERAVFEALDGMDFTTARSGELTVIRLTPQLVEQGSGRCDRTVVSDGGGDPVWT